MFYRKKGRKDKIACLSSLKFKRQRHLIEHQFYYVYVTPTPVPLANQVAFTILFSFRKLSVANTFQFKNRNG